MESWGAYTCKNRQTGSIITLADNRDGLHDDDPDAKWMTVCDTHSTYVTSETRAAAYAAMVTPWDWCEECDKAFPYGR